MLIMAYFVKAVIVLPIRECFYRDPLALPPIHLRSSFILNSV